jgi:hypothetical protein
MSRGDHSIMRSSMRRGAFRAAAGVAACAVLAALVACQDLDVTNPNEPDRDRARRSANSIEAFVSGAFRSWWEWVHDDSPVWVFSTMADEFTAAFGDFGILQASSEPRVAWNNSTVSGDREANEDPWYGWYSMLSTVNDALTAIDSGLVIGDESQTRRAEAVGKFMQALGHGYVGLTFDQAYILSEAMDVDQVEDPEFSPYQEVMDSAIVFMEEAVAIADANSFTLPEGSWLYTQMTSEELARLGHSYIARFLAYTPRTREERANVDWGAVIQHVDAGVTADFAPTAVVDVLFDDFKRVAARTRGSGSSFIPGDFARVDYMLVGPADSTNGFINWLAKPPAERTVFQLRTKDRRIHPAGNPGGRGLYLGYSTTNRFQASRGTYHQSRYFFHRFGEGLDWQVGPQEALTVTEMRLLKAEALIRLNRADEAVSLINVTRVANGGLAPVTIDGPPDEPGCVPRKFNGACGSLWDALRYEKRIEGIGVDGMNAFFDARGWQALPEDSFVHFPVPGRELAVREEPLYSFGGGGPGSAPPPDPERCPVALPRCP